MNTQRRVAYLLGATGLAALGLALRAPVAAWAACLLTAPTAWPGVREWRELRPRLAGLAVVTAATALLDAHPAIAAAALAIGSATGSRRAPRSLAPAAIGLAGCTGVLRGAGPAVGVLTAACVAWVILQVAEAVADRALARAARGGVLVSGRDALRVAAGIDGVVLALPGRAGDSGPRRASWTRAAPGRGPGGMAGRLPALLRAPADRGKRLRAPAIHPRRPARAAGRGMAAVAMRAAAGLRALGCEVWQRGGRVVPLRRRADDDAFAVADMLARGRRVAVVTAPGVAAPAADLAVQAGGRLRQAAAPAVVLPGEDLGPLVDFLRLARRAHRTAVGLGVAAVLAGGPGLAVAAMGRLPFGAAAAGAVAAAALLATCGPWDSSATIFTNSQRPYG